MIAPQNGSRCRINVLKPSAAFHYEFDSPNPLYAVRMNDFFWTKRLEGITNAKDDSNTSVHTDELKSRAPLLEDGDLHTCVNYRWDWSS